jgi:hypothetical protein
MFLLKNKKKIKFENKTYIYYVPNIEMYNSCNLIEVLWYSDIDYINFKNSTKLEIQELMNKHLNMSIKDAIYLLYINTKIIYNPSFFIKLI